MSQNGNFCVYIVNDGTRMTQEQFKEEARRLRPRLMETARRYVGDDDAEDAVQDALLCLWQMVGDLRLPIDALAVRLTRNLCIDRLRRQHPIASSSVLSPSAFSPPVLSVALDGSPVGEANDDDERIDRMMAVIETLPSLQQTILRLRHLEGMEMKDIAELIGSSEVAIRKAPSRARQAVRSQYMKQYEQ